MNLREAFAARIEQVLSLAENERQADDVERLAALYEFSVNTYVTEIVKPNLRAAVLARPRLVDEWDWTSFLFTEEDINTILRRDLSNLLLSRDHPSQRKPDWPMNVAPKDVQAALGQIDDPHARLLYERFSAVGFAAMLEKQLGESAKRSKMLGRMCRDLQEIAAKKLVQDGVASTSEDVWTVPSSVVDNSPIFEIALVRWPLLTCALIVSIAKDVEADRHIPAVKMGARPAARATFRMLAEGPPTKGGFTRWVPGQTGLNKHTGNFELVWEGRRDPYQLALLGDEPLSAGLVKAIQAELQDEGVRDWLTFHVMVERQGGTGDFRWAWREHRELAGYDRMLANKSARTTDSDFAAGCVARIARLTRAEVRMERERGGRIFWVRLGDHGLLDVPAGIDELTTAGRLTTVADMRLNRYILAGARAREREPYYALIHQGIIALPRIPRTLGTLLAFDWRVARDNGGSVTRTARTLWDYARILGGQWKQQKRWPQARRSLDHALDVLGKTIGLNWQAEPDGAHGLDSPDAMYTIAPPAWWRDRVIYSVPPVLDVSTAGVPRTGAELATWRAEHGVSLRQAGDILDVSHEAVRKAEAKGEASLPAEWLPRLGRHRRGG